MARVLLAMIHDNGICPCPRCLISKSKLDKLGLKRDSVTRVSRFRHYMAGKIQIARKAIYSLGKPINGVAVEGVLKYFSGVPTMVQFALLLLCYFADCLSFRMHLLSVWAMNSTLPKYLW